MVHHRGILLHGEPGCGKTLAVRALAGACSRAGGQRPVALFARKAADCLGKHYGDAERTLRLLFEEVHSTSCASSLLEPGQQVVRFGPVSKLDTIILSMCGVAARHFGHGGCLLCLQASRAAPSIIFLDELDALAPVRSTREGSADQVPSALPLVGSRPTSDSASCMLWPQTLFRVCQGLQCVACMLGGEATCWFWKPSAALHCRFMLQWSPHCWHCWMALLSGGMWL
jgi:DNA polymerase III delta prime subunit